VPVVRASSSIKEIIVRTSLKARWLLGLTQSNARPHAADRGDLFRDLRTGQHAPLAGLGALGELELDAPDRGQEPTVLDEPGHREVPLEVPAAEIAGADLEDHVGPELVIGRRALLRRYCDNSRPPSRRD